MPPKIKGIITSGNTMSHPDRRFWGWPGTGAVQNQSSLYTLGIWDLKRFAFFDSWYPADAAQKKSQSIYQFTTPPQSYEVVEPAATTIVPTQGGGKFVESQGNLFKDIRIAGTVGFRPNVPSKNLIPGLERFGVDLENPIPEVLTRDNRGLNPKEVTGFDEMIHLRNIFRQYFDLKDNVQYANRVVMIWIYLKEGEAYIVEPLTFAVSRSSANPMSWEYNISMRSLYKLDVVSTKPPDVVNIFQAGINISKQIRSFNDQFGRNLRALANNINVVANLPANILQDFFDDALTVVRGLSAVSKSVRNFDDVVQESVLRTLNSNIREMRELLEIEATSQDNPKDGSIGQSQHNLIQSQWVANGILALDGLWTRLKTQKVQDYSAAYLDEGANAPLTSGSALDIGSITLPTATAQVSVEPGSTIRGLAKKYLGSEAEWKKLSLMNNLKYPYVASESGDGVLGPGDTILIPVEDNGQTDSLLVPREQFRDVRFQDADPLARKYGRDLKLTRTGEGALLGDLKVNQRGDLDFVDGVENVDQSVRVKFNTGQGELSVHPEFGAKFPIGRKVDLPRFQEFAIAVRQTIMQDPRVEDIEKMRILTQGDVIMISAQLNLRDYDTRLPFTESFRR